MRTKKMEGVGERGLRTVGVGATDQWSCCNKMCMLWSKVVEERGDVLRRIFSECCQEESCGCDRCVFIRNVSQFSDGVAES